MVEKTKFIIIILSNRKEANSPRKKKDYILLLHKPGSLVYCKVSYITSGNNAKISKTESKLDNLVVIKKNDSLIVMLRQIEKIYIDSKFDFEAIKFF